MIIRKRFSEEIRKKKVTLAVIREKRAALSDLKHYSDLQLRDKIRYIIGTCEESTGMKFLFVYFEKI